MFEASSPARLDIMGGIADYSGSMVLQMALPLQTTVRLVPLIDFQCRVVSNGQTATLDYRDLLLPDRTVDYGFAEAYFSTHNELHWTSYVVGSLLVLQKEKKVVPRGFEFNIDSNIPIGKGISSSAALVLASLKALSQFYNLNYVGTELPILAQMVENLIVGAPCGLMDQLASHFGKAQVVLPILCQPDHVLEEIILPNNLQFIGIDSDLRHSVGNSSYGTVRTASFMGLKIINTLFGLNEKYLSNITVKDFEQKYQKRILETYSGKEFIQLYGSIEDEVSTIEEDRIYFVKQATSHPIYENHRINIFKEILLKNSKKHINQDDLERLGEMMYESHESYTKCGLGSAATDSLVNMVKAKKGQGVYGAKITGGGLGGTVCVLCDTNVGLKIMEQIHEEYSLKVGRKVMVF